MVERGEIQLVSSQTMNVGNAACMVTSASMPVIVVEDKIFGGRGFAPLHPGGNPKCLRWGLYSGMCTVPLWGRQSVPPGALM